MKRLIALTAAAIFSAQLEGRSGLVDERASITITLLGTGNPRPSLSRFGPSTLVEAGTERLLIDAGRGATIRLFEIGSAGTLAGITGVFLTHLHSDHVVGLPDLWLTGWLFGRRTPLEVYGPPGTRDLAANLERAFSFDVTMRSRDERLPGEGAALQAGDVEPGLVFDRNGVRVRAFTVDHAPVTPAYGYRVDYADRSVVFSGDTRYSEKIVEAARGADVIVHEVVSPEVERKRARVKDPGAVERIIARHTTPEDAGRIFAAVRPRLAVYSHIVPSPATASDLVAPTRRTYDGRLAVGYDLMRISVGRQVTVTRAARVPD